MPASSRQRLKYKALKQITIFPNLEKYFDFMNIVKEGALKTLHDKKGLRNDDCKFKELPIFGEVQAGKCVMILKHCVV